MALKLLLIVFIFYLARESTQRATIKFEKNVGIVGGHEITIDKAPYMASLQIKNWPLQGHLCGASIIDDQFLLTAAHCIHKSFDYFVKVGATKAGSEGTVYEIEKIIPHKKFGIHHEENDICLIKLQKKLSFGQKVAKIKLPESGFTIPNPSTLLTSGYGDTQNSIDEEEVLRQVALPFVPTDECKKEYKPYHDFKIGKKMICAGGHGKGSCQGDRGGPLTLNGTQVGVFSFGHGCAAEPGVYTEVAAYLHWIKTNMNANK